MSRLLLTITFDGTNYHGWQVQENAITVQQVLQETLKSILGFQPALTGCSRTDSGVHANEFCCHFDYTGSISEKNIVNALNAKLPKDISAVRCIEVDNNFHARYSCISKEYIYKIWNCEYRNPFYEKYALHIKYPLDIDKMNKAAAFFKGKHDFKGFCSSGSSVIDTVRDIKNIEIKKENDIVIIKISADGFLYNMVRIIAGTLIYVSEGKINTDEINNIIASGQRERAGATAPPYGLYLNKVNY